MVEQPGDKQAGDFVSVSRSKDGKFIVAYLPQAKRVKFNNLYNINNDTHCFNPVANKTTKGKVSTKNGILEITSPAADNDD